MSPDDRPTAPASSAASTSPTIAASSASVGGRASAPRTDAADRAVTDEERDVRPERLLVDPVEVLPERPPARRRAGSAAAPARRARRPSSVRRREGLAAVARQLRRVALVEVAGERAVDEDATVRVPVRIDEPGRARPGPSQSIDRSRPSPSATADRSPTARIRSPSTPTSARTPGAPVPSMTVPPRSRRSKGHGPMVPRPAGPADSVTTSPRPGGGLW